MSRAPHRGAAVSAILVATFANYLTFTVLTIALGGIAREFDADVNDAAWITIAPALVSGLLTPAFGSLGDRFGRRRVFLLGLCLFAIGTSWTAGAPSLASLVGARVLTGVGAAASMPSGIALATSLYPPESRTVPMGYWTSVTALAPALGVLLGSATAIFSWRYLFLGQLPFALFSIVATLRFVPESHGDRTGRFDAAGAMLLGTAFLLLTLAANRAHGWGPFSARTVGATLVAMVLLVVVAQVERRVENPVVPLRTLANPIVRLALAGRSVMYAVHMGSFLLLPLFLLDVCHMDYGGIFLALLPRPLAMGFAAPLAAYLERRFSSSATLLLGVGSMFLGIADLTRIGPDVTPLGLLPSLLFMGVGLGISQTVTASEITGHADAADLGSSSAMLAISTALSGSLGSAGLLAFATRPGVAPLDAYRSAFIACTVLCAVALAIATLHVRARREAGR